MSVETRGTLKETLEKTVSKNGAAFFAMFSFSSLLFFIAVESRAAATAATGPLKDILPTPFIEPGALAFPMPRLYAVGLAFFSLFIGSYFAVITTRVFVFGYDGIPKKTYAEDIGKVTVNMFFGTLAFAPLFIGSLFLPALIYLSTYGFGFSPLLVVALVAGVIPCAFISVTFAFYVPYTTVEHEGFIEAFSLSWGMTSGHRLGLCGFFFVFLFFLLVVATLGLSAYVLLWEISTLVAQLMLGFGSSAALVFTLSLVATIYRKHHSIESTA
jgi:hypothetical protein